MARSHRRSGRPFKIFFAADLHGSEVAYRKFLSAASFYGVDALVFGGDLMGKVFVPIVLEGGTYRASLPGERQAFESDRLEPLVGNLGRMGSYWKVMDREAYGVAAGDPLARQGLFQEAATKRLESWLALAEERLAGTGVRLYVTGGNDDDPEVLRALDRHAGQQVVGCEGLVVDLDGEHTMVTVGWSTETPWGTPREATEERIAEMIEASVARVPDVGRCVFNFHCPPKDTPIDTCLALEKGTGLESGELPRPIRVGGQYRYVGGGSRAVREAVSRYQPAVSLHGHIHESGGWFRIGRTRSFNPGSEYAQGQLQGWIVGLRAGSLTSYQHTSG